MNHTAVLGALAMFFLGAGVALIATYPIDANSIVVVIVGVSLVCLAALGAATAVVLDSIRRHHASSQRVLDATVDGIRARQGLDVVRRD